MPTAPPAPVRFTTTTGCLRDFCITVASGRPTMSATPPGGNGTIIVIGLDGYDSCATALPPASAASRLISARNMDPPRGAESNTRLQLLHFARSLSAPPRVKWPSPYANGVDHDQEDPPRRRGARFFRRRARQSPALGARARLARALRSPPLLLRAAASRCRPGAACRVRTASPGRVPVLRGAGGRA